MFHFIDLGSGEILGSCFCLIQNLRQFVLKGFYDFRLFRVQVFGFLKVFA